MTYISNTVYLRYIATRVRQIEVSELKLNLGKAIKFVAFHLCW